MTQDTVGAPTPEATSAEVLTIADTFGDPTAAFNAQRESIIADLLKGQAAMDGPKDTPAPAPAAALETVKAEPPKEDPNAALFARIAAMDAEIASLKRPAATPAPAAKAPKTTISADELRYNPMAALKEAGISPEVLAQFMVAEHAGANAPVDFRVQAALMPQLGALQASLNERTAALQARLDEFEQKSRLEAYEASLHEFVTGVSTEAYPLLARATKADADGVLEDILDVVRHDAQRRAAAGESGQPMSHADAAKVVEARYAAVSKRLAAEAPGVSAAPSTQGGPSAAGKSGAPPATMSSLSRVTANTRPKSLEEIEEEIKLELIRKASQPA